MCVKLKKNTAEHADILYMKGLLTYGLVYLKNVHISFWDNNFNKTLSLLYTTYT